LSNITTFFNITIEIFTVLHQLYCSFPIIFFEITFNIPKPEVKSKSSITYNEIRRGNKMNSEIILQKKWFSEKEQTILTSDDMSVSIFLYSTGVAAVKIMNKTGFIIVLPYQGQQIWDAEFGGRSLKMKTFFDEPVKSGDLFDSYGALLFHCGALRMGCPGPEDDHPLHGELPAAPYSSASITVGEDEKGSFIGITGAYHYAKAFGDKYNAVPLTKLYAGSSVADVSITIKNLASYPMDLMYMCHVNFLPADNGELVQAAGWNTEDMIIRSSIPAHVKPTRKYLDFMEKLKSSPEATRIIKPEDDYNPEIVFYINNLKADSDGRTHIMQKHTDGTADYISYDPSDLNHNVRWFLKHEDQKVIGMALPSTCDPEGYTAEKKKGNVRSLEAGAEKTFSVSVGFLPSSDADRIKSRIESL
jgi:hypothetical protein